MSVTGTDSQILEMFFAQLFEVGFEFCFQSSGQGYGAMFSSFAIMDGYGSLTKIEIFDA
jgi:hypothetical protein